MSKSTDILKQYYGHFNKKEWKSFFALLAENVVHDINQGGREVGIAKFQSFIDRMNKCYDEQITDIVLMSDDSGKNLAATYTVSGVYLATDEGLPPARKQKYKIPGGAFFTITNGKVQSVRNYYNLPEWLEAVK